MNKKSFLSITGVAVVSIGLLLTGCGSSQADGSSNAIKSTMVTASTTVPANAQVVNVVAKNFEWDLDKTSVKAGQPVELIVKGQEGMHGLTIDGTDISDVQVGTGSTQKILFTPTQAGDLQIHCTIMCGVGHGQMHADLKVTE